MKLDRAYLEHRIFKLLHSDNNTTPHFEYKVNFEQGTITLDLYTYNPFQKALHFLYSVTEQTPSLCLTKMVIYL